MHITHKILQVALAISILSMLFVSYGMTDAQTACADGEVLTLASTGLECVSAEQALLESNNCPEGQFLQVTTVNGVRQVTCASVPTVDPPKECGTGEYVRGVNNDGSLDCATIQTVPSCAVSVSPASPTTAQSFTLTVTPRNFSAAGNYTYRWKFDTQSRILREETTAMTSDTLSINAGDIANPYNSPYYVTVTKSTQSTSCGIVVPVVAATVPSCSGGSVSWTVNNKTCTGSLDETKSGSSDTAIDSNRPPTGSATYHCNNDRTWGEPTSASCADDPPHCQEDDEVTWTVGSHTCTGSRDETNSGSSDTATDSTGPSTGSATYSCNNGAWTEPTNTSCESTTLPPLKCSGGSVDWSVDNHDCTGSRDETNSGSSDTATDSTGPSTGSATYSCNNGDWIATSMSCGYGDPPCNCTPSATDSTTAGTRATPHTWCKRSCAGRTVRWTVNGKTCSGSLPEVTPEADIGENPTTVWDTTGTTRGRAIYDCNDGTLSNPLFAWCTSATTSCAADTVSWTKNGRTCTASRPMAPSGGEVFIRSTEGTSRGSAKYLCTNGTWSDEPSFALCDRTCAGGTVNWTVGSHTCTGTRTTTRHGGGSVARDATKPTIGVAAYRCVNGTWRTMFSRYDASWIFWRHWSDNMHDSIWLSGTGATCSSTSCPADIVTWSEDNNRICRFSRSITPSGAYANLLDTDGSTGGGGFYKCNDNGSWDDADSTNACTTSGCLQDGVCDTSRQNRCSSGTLYNDANDSAVADTTTHYKWRCDGRNGGKNSPVCEKEKPCGTCNCTTSKTDATNAGTCSTTGNTCTVSANNCPKSPKCGSWSPARNTVCSGTRFTQFRTCNTECNNCATSRLTTGTKPQSGTWSPARNTVCSGKRFTQSRTCGSRSTTGTKPATNCQWGPWSDWSTCSNGSQSRSRSKTVTESTCGTCSGSSTQSQCCGSGCTPVPCVCTASKTDAANKGTLSDGSGACTVTANNCPTKTCNCTTSKTDATNAGTWSDGSGACNEANNCPQTPVCNNAEVDECLVGRKSNTGTRCQDTTTLDRWCCIGKPDTEIAYCDIKKPGCEDKDVTWGTQCGGSTGTASASGSKVVANTKAGYTGSATYSCNNETWSGPTASSCRENLCEWSTWSPAANTKTCGTSFTQERTCGSGDETKQETQTATGTKPSAWSTYAPATSTVCSDESFTQERTRTCGDPTSEERTARGTATWSTWSPAANTKTCGTSFTQERTCGSGDETKQETQTATGTKPSAWSTYAPATSTVCSDESFTQERTRTCGDPTSEERTARGTATWSTWSPAANTKTCGTSFTQERTCGSGDETKQETQTATGTKPSAWSTYAPATSTVCSDESFTQERTRTCGDPTSEERTARGTATWSTWSPAANTKTCGTSFTQERTCGSGDETKQETQTATGTKPSAWSTYAPATSTVCSDESFTQERTRTCGDPTSEERTARGTATWSTWSPAANTKTCGTSFTQERTCGSGDETKQETQTATGTKPSAWSTYAPATSTVCSDESFTQERTRTCGDPTSEERTARGTATWSTWSPAANTKTCGTSFTQERTCGSGDETKQETQTATGTKPSAWSTYAPATSTVCSDESFTQERTRTCGDPTSEERTARGTATWSTWSPAANTKTCGTSFTQTRTCGSGDETKQETQTATGTKPRDGGWSTYGSCECTSSTFDAANAGTQSRTCNNPVRGCSGSACSGSASQSCTVSANNCLERNGQCGGDPTISGDAFTGYYVLNKHRNSLCKYGTSYGFRSLRESDQGGTQHPNPNLRFYKAVWKCAESSNDVSVSVASCSKTFFVPGS